MRVLYCEWNAYANNYIKKAFIKANADVITYPFNTQGDMKRDEAKIKALLDAIFEIKPDFVFSINYFPVIAIACQACRIKYASWTYDSPYILLYSDTIKLETNYAFIFDKSEYLKLKSLGINTVYYLPMAADVEYLSKFHASEKYKADVAMIGSMYSEKKHRMMDHFANVSEYCKGYLEGAIQAQKFLYGVSITENLINEDILKELEQAAPMLNPEDELQSPSWTYAKYFLDREVTRLERKELLELVSKKYKTNLYTYEKTPFLPNIRNMGPIDYYSEAPIAIKSTKINLNISLRSINSGIPLRAFDVMGCGGFLMTNYQSDFLDLFIPDTDFIYFESSADFLCKIEYYLAHSKERCEIARNSCERISISHTYDARINKIFELLA